VRGSARGPTQHCAEDHSAARPTSHLPSSIRQHHGIPDAPHTTHNRRQIINQKPLYASTYLRAFHYQPCAQGNLQPSPLQPSIYHAEAPPIPNPRRFVSVTRLMRTIYTPPPPLPQRSQLARPPMLSPSHSAPHTFTTSTMGKSDANRNEQKKRRMYRNKGSVGNHAIETWDEQNNNKV
jgi:hypothetical protein